MIKSVSIVKKSEKDFPKLMEYNGLVILMREAVGEPVGEPVGVGTVVVVGKDKNWRVGEYCRNWDMRLFKDFDGSVTLSNQ